jgi:cytochrome c oxidase assembly protein subunit 15
MGDQWIADQVTMKSTFFENILENPSGIQFMHRTIAFIIVLILAWLWYRSNKLNLTRQQHWGFTLLIYGVTVQFMLGVFTLLYHVPVLLGALHQTGAFFLFASAIYLLFHLYNRPQAS